jgi:AcrR family transcriptional regulator
VPADSAPAKQSLRSTDKREAILSAAALVFNEHGVRGASLGEIAASVGLVTSGITYYFRKKDELAAACFLRSIAEVQALAIEAAHESKARSRVSRLLALYLDQAAAIQCGERPPLIHFSDLLALSDAQAPAVLAAYVDMFRSIRTLVTSANDVVLSRQALNARAHLLLSVLNSITGWTPRFEVDQYSRMAERISDILLNGVIGPTDTFSAEEDGPLIQPLPATAFDEVAESFLLAATMMVNDHGYRGASVEKISSMLNATKGKFYHHNETKFDLITACFERSFALQRHFLKSAELLDGPAARRVAAASIAMAQFQLSEHGPLLRASAISALPDQHHRSQVFDTMQRLIERITSLLVDGIVDGSVRAQDTALAAQILYTQINAAAELRRWVPDVRVEDVTRLYTRATLFGLLCDDSRSAE